MNLLFAIHDFLPRHRAGSEIYAATLAAELSRRHHVTVVCAEFDPGRRHGQVTWRVYEGVPVVEIVNNWVGRSFADTYRPELVTQRLSQVLDAVQPDVLHVHNLLNLSFDLPALARARGIPVVATLHDYTLVCPSGGQRVHRAESHVCWTIETTRCARCFVESPFYSLASGGALASAVPSGWAHKAVGAMARRSPALASGAATAARHMSTVRVTPNDIELRLIRARQIFGEVERFVAPSHAMADEYVRLGIDRDRIEVSLNGHASAARVPVSRPRRPLRLGFVGTVVWHKGVHVLVDAVRHLSPGTYEVRIYGSLEVAPDYGAELRKRAEGLAIRFEGAFEPAGVGEVFAEIDVLVVPSVWPENAPLVIQEASLAGVPVIGARIGGIPEFVIDGVGGQLFTPGDADELGCILRELIESPQQVAAWATAGLPVRSIEDDASAWEARYRDVAAGGKRGRAS